MSEFNLGGDSAVNFGDPFLLPSKEAAPTDLKSALDFCLYLYYMNPQYRRASIWAISHFITEITFSGKGGDAEEQKEFKRYLMTQLDLFGCLLVMGEEWAALGNSFWRVHYPFDRVLVDKRNGRLTEHALSSFDEGSISFNLSDMTYTVPDPETEGKTTVSLTFRDRKRKSSSGIRLRPLEARNITIRHASISGSEEYIYRFPDELVADIKNGELYQINETPYAMLLAIANNQDFLFERDEIFHFKAPAVSGVSNRGWGVPEPLLNYSSLHQIQVYRKIDEQVGRDYLLPFRLFSPTDTNSEYGHGFNLDAGEWTHHIRALIQGKRRSPERVHAFPYPVNYQEFGASGKQLTPKDLIEYQTNDMLAGLGYPADLFRGSLQYQQVPIVMRLFENSFRFIYRGFNQFLKWVSSKVTTYLGMPTMDVSLVLPTVADDIEKRSVYLQLAAGGEIARATAFRSFNISDPVEEAKKRITEDNEIAKLRQKAQKELERELENGSMNAAVEREEEAAAEEEQAAAQGAPQQTPNGPGATPVDSLQGQAEQIAAQLLRDIPDDGERAKQLTQIRVSNPELHAMVKQKMEEMRSNAASTGRKQVAQMLQ